MSISPNRPEPAGKWRHKQLAGRLASQQAATSGPIISLSQSIARSPTMCADHARPMAGGGEKFPSPPRAIGRPSALGKRVRHSSPVNPHASSPARSGQFEVGMSSRERLSLAAPLPAGRPPAARRGSRAAIRRIDWNRFARQCPRWSTDGASRRSAKKTTKPRKSALHTSKIKQNQMTYPFRLESASSSRRCRRQSRLALCRACRPGRGGR